MAFDNVTFFELHLDSPSFGGEQSPERAEPVEVEQEVPARRSRLVPLGFLAVAVGAAVAARRMRRDADLEVDLEDAEPIPVE
jgi:hypothetical protein